MNPVGSVWVLLTEIELKMVFDWNVTQAIKYIRVSDMARYHIGRVRVLFDSTSPPSEPSGVADWALVGGRAGGGS